jgi:hypothetical protein
MNKNNAFKTILVVFGFSLIALTMSAEAETIDGRKVYVDTARLYFEAFPHTIHTGDDTIYFDFMSKDFNGNIDIAFGFDTDIVKPKKAELLIGAEWIDVSSAFLPVGYEYGGMDRWYIAQSINIDSMVHYKMRGTFEIVGKGNGKYWVCAKPSAQTISQAIASGNFLCLDPWFDVNYLYKRPINASCENCTGLVTIPVLVNGTVGFDLANGKQYVWCNLSVNQTDRTVGWLYYNNETNYICSNLQETANVTMDVDRGNETDNGNPWGNSANFIFHSNRNEALVDSSVNPINCTMGGSPIVADGLIGWAINYDGSTDYYDCGDWDSYTTEITFMGWANSNNPFGANQHMFMKWNDCGGAQVLDMGFIGLSGSFTSEVAGSGSISTNGTYLPNTWNHFAITVDGSLFKLYANGVLQDHRTSAGISTNNCNLFVGRSGAGGGQEYWDGELDELRVYNRSLSADEIMAMYDVGRVELGQEQIFGDVEIRIFEPQNTTYSSVNVSLNVSSNITVNVWSYSLNGANFTQFIPNTTITAQEGANYIEVFGYISDEVNDTDSVSFTVTTPEPPSVPSNITVEFTITGNLPVINTSCEGDYYVVTRGKEQGVRGDESFIAYQIDRTYCTEGCDNMTIRNLLNAGCKENFMEYLLYFFIIVTIVAIVLRFTVK